MVYVFIYTFPTAGDRLYVQLQDAATLATITEVSYPVNAAVSSGAIYVPLEHLIDAKLKWDRPTQTVAGAGALLVNEQLSNIAGFKVRYRVAQTGAAISWTQDNQTVRAAKGGIGNMDFNQEDAVNYQTSPALPAGSRFLTWVPSGRWQTPDEWAWLLFMCTATADHRVRYIVNYLDGTTGTIVRAFNSGAGSGFQYRNFFIPAGVAQAALDPAAKGVATVTVTVDQQLSPGFFLPVESYTITIDNRPQYNALTLYYRNSIGGWDNIQLRGARKRMSEAERKEADTPAPYSAGRTPFYNASIRPKWTANTGYISKQHLLALDDLLRSTECALLIDGAWLPVRITSKSLQAVSTADNLYQTAIEFEAAGSFEAFAPQLANLL